MTAAAVELPGTEPTPADVSRLAACGIPAGMAARACIRRVDSEMGRAIVGRNGSGDYAGLLFPYFVPGENRVREYRLRRDHPEMEYQADGSLKERAKYLSPPGRGNMLYFVPGTEPATLTDTDIPILITEGEKKGLALSALFPQRLAIGLGGAWNWRGTKGKATGPEGDRRDIKGPISDLDRIKWLGRRVTIVFDANVSKNESVAAARRELAKELSSRGASVYLVDLPETPGVNGVDDLIGAWGPERVVELIDGAQPYRARYSNHDAAEVPVVRWPEPLAEEAFHGLAGDIVRIVEPHSEADVAGLLIHTLVAFGNLIGRGGYFSVGGTVHRANLNAVLVGATASRKGTAKDDTFFVIRTVDPEWFDTRIQSGLSSGEGLVWAVRDPIEQQEAIKEKGRIVDYQTVVSDPGIPDKRLLLVESEFGSTLRVLEREGNTLSAQIRQAWDSGDLRVLTKTKTARATGAHISILGHVTRDELLKYLGETEQANGFANRFLWVCVRRSKLLPDGGALAAADLAGIRERLSRAAAFARTCGEVRRSAEARELWHAVYPKLAGDRLGLFGAVTSRAEAQVMRLALVYALLDRTAVIEPAHLMAALGVWTYCEQSARFVFGDALGDSVADELLMALRSSAEGLTRTDISHHFGRNKSAAQVGRALTLLCQHGLIRSEKETLPTGRPAERWFAVSPGTKETKLTKEVGEGTV